LAAMKNPAPAAGRLLGLLSLFVAASVVAGALVAGLFVPAVAAMGGATKGSINWFNGVEVSLPSADLSQQSVLLASDGRTPIAQFYAENRRPVTLNKISADMQNAIIAIEDSRFRDHGGVDPIGLVRAAVSDYMGNGTQVQGASTLTQQYIKNLFVEQAARRGDKAGVQAATAKDAGRKILEIRAAIDLEKKMTKNQILEAYLNIAYFGNGAYGVEAAAERYFSIHASHLSLEQSALLAGVVQAPFTYDPILKKKNAKNRRDTVLARMHELGVITDQQYGKAVKTPIRLNQKLPRSGCVAAGRGLGFFCEYVRQTIAQGADAFAKLGSTKQARIDTLYRGGLRITSTIDVKTQAAAWNSVKKYVPIGDKSRVAAAAVTVEPNTGHVLAMAENKNFSPKDGRGSTEINYNVDANLGGSAGFQTGSTFKAFTLAAWLKEGHGLNAVIDASRKSIPQNEFTTCHGDHVRLSSSYDFGNSEPNAAKRLTVLDATAGSVNTAFVNMETQMQLCDISNVAGSMGVHLAAADGRCDPKHPYDIPSCFPSMTLGPFSISPLSMASGYATFASEGTYCPPFPVLSIKDADGHGVPIKAPTCDKEALDPDIAHGVTYALKGVLTHGTATNINGQVPGHVAGKTGTTNESVDTWFVGYSKQRTTAVWVGDPTIYTSGKRQFRKSMNQHHASIGGRSYPNDIFGATIAAPIWAGIMKTAVQGTDTSDWPGPPSSMLGGSGSTASRGSDVPDVTGKSIGAAFAILAQAGFAPQVGDSVDSDVPAGFVASTDPGAGSGASAGDPVVVHPSNGRGGGGTGQGTAFRHGHKRKGPPWPPRT
jgi:membrane peptidoglycan carboxypeptidase